MTGLAKADLCIALIAYKTCYYSLLDMFGCGKIIRCLFDCSHYVCGISHEFKKLSRYAFSQEG